MKSFNKILLLLVAGMLFSCELNRIPTDSVVDEEFWKTEQDYVLACNAFYVKLPTYDKRDQYSDIGYSGSPNEISSGTYLPENNFGPWDEDYKNIALANKVIQFAQSNPNKLDDAIVKRYEGEARFFRAIQYYDLLRSYGGVPIVDKMLDINSEELYAPRDSRSDVVDFILQDLDFASKNLPLQSKLKDEEQGRFTSGAAYTMLSRVALYEGTRQKFLGNGEYTKLLEMSRDAALNVINSNEYDLFTSANNDPVLNYQQCFIYEGEGSKETVLANRYIKPWRKHSFAMVIRTSDNCPTRAIVDAYLCDDGLPISVSDKFLGFAEPSSEFQNRDSRMRASLLVPYDDLSYDLRPFEPTFGNGASQTGYVWKKMGVYEDATALEGDCDVIIIRYAEALLNYAEACFELNETIEDSELEISINKLRQRVNMPKLTNSFINGGNPKGVKLDMREEIRRERLVELANEGFRYDDLLRWGIADEVLKKPLLGIPDLREFYTYVGENVWEKVKNGFVEVQPASTRFFEDKNWLWPIPLMQIALNPNLEQNPKWK